VVIKKIGWENGISMEWAIARIEAAGEIIKL